MAEQIHGTLKCLSRWGIVTALGLGIVICFSVPAWSQPKKHHERNWRSYQRLSPKESLPPERRSLLRSRLEQWRELPPEERTLYEKRFNQWQKLSPEERQRIREKLEKWNGLPPQDREGIRRRFRTP